MEIKRGDVFWIKDSYSVGSEERLRRPVVVVSSDKGNETSNTLLGVFLTTKPKWGAINVPLMINSKKNWVMCNQLGTFDRLRFEDYICTLAEDEMAAIDEALHIALGLQPQPQEDKSAEVAELKKKIADYENQIKQRDTNIGIYKKLYEKALDMVVDVKLGKDLAAAEELRSAEVKKPVEVKREEKSEAAEKPEEKQVEINTCTAEELRSAGCTPTMIKYIIENRPYKSLEELKTLPNVTRIGYQIVSQRLTCVPVLDVKWKKDEPRKAKVNVNTAKATEIREATGMNATTASAICGYRTKNGRYEKLEDLLNVKGFGEICMKRYGSMLEV
jgi:competence protein ComEA